MAQDFWHVACNIEVARIPRWQTFPSVREPGRLDLAASDSPAYPIKLLGKAMYKTSLGRFQRHVVSKLR